MARPTKQGLNYFPLDVDFFDDEKIEFVNSRFGLKGEAISVRLLCKIYRNGYFMEFNEDTALLFAKRVGGDCQHSLVKDVVYELVKRGFFDKTIFEQFGVLTSNGIQKRYLQACMESKRKNFKINPKFEINPLSGGETPLTPEETPLTGGESTQSKVKESKVNSLYACEEFSENNYSLSHDELLKEWHSAQLWQETLVMTDAKYKSVENVKKLMTEFCIVLKKADQFPIGMKEAKNRFAGWCDRNGNSANSKNDSNKLSTKYV